MAKPIKAIQVLSGEYADKFVEKMLAKEKAVVTTQEKKLVREVEEKMRLLLVC